MVTSCPPERRTAVGERSGPGVLVDDQGGEGAGRDRRGGLGEVVLAEDPRGRAPEVLQRRRVLGQLAEVDRGDVAVLVLGEDREVEHADDPALDEVEDDRRRLAGRRVVGPLDQHVVDRTHSLQFTGFHGLSFRASCALETTLPRRWDHHPIA